MRSYVGCEEHPGGHNRIYREYFKEPLPARTTLVGVLGKTLKLELDMMAYPGGPVSI